MDEHEKRAEEERTRGVAIPVSPSSSHAATRQRRKETDGLFQKLDTVLETKGSRAIKKRKMLSPSRPAALSQSTVLRLRDEIELETNKGKKAAKKKGRTEKIKKILKKKLPTRTPVTPLEYSVHSTNPDILDIERFTLDSSEEIGNPEPPPPY